MVCFGFRAQLICCLLPSYPPLPLEQRDKIAADVHRSVTQLICLAPWHIRSGEKVLRFLLMAWMMVTVSGPLKATNICAINQSLSQFQQHSNTLAGVIRLYRSLLTLSFYEHPLVVQELNRLSSPTRQYQ